LLHGAAEREAELLLRVRRLRPGDACAGRVEPFEVLARVQPIVPKKEEGAAGAFVRPALRHDVDDARRGVAELRGIGSGEHLKLLHRLLAEGGANRAVDGVVVVDAVDHDVVRPCALPDERQTGARRGALLRRAVGRDAGRQQRERDEVAAVRRQILDLIARDEARDRGALWIDERLGGGHRHADGHRVDDQRQLEIDRRSKREEDVLAGVPCEPRRVRNHRIRARRQRRNDKTAIAVGRDRALKVRRLIDDRHPCRRQDAARLVAYDTRQIRRRDAALGGGSPIDREHEDDEHQASTHEPSSVCCAG